MFLNDSLIPSDSFRLVSDSFSGRVDCEKWDVLIRSLPTPAESAPKKNSKSIIKLYVFNDSPTPSDCFRLFPTRFRLAPGAVITDKNGAFRQEAFKLLPTLSDCFRLRKVPVVYVLQ